MALELPECGLYRTTSTVASVPAGRLVYFHNHGSPGPGVYLPKTWHQNVAEFQAQGHTITDLSEVAHLEPLMPEGLYRVKEPFTCCDKECMTFAAEQLVQLGYPASGEPILFLPRWSESGLVIPRRGQKVERDRLSKISRLVVPKETAPPVMPNGTVVH